MIKKSGFSLVENIVAIALVSICILALSRSQALLTNNKVKLIEYDLAINLINSEIARIKLLDSEASVDRSFTSYFKFSGSQTTSTDPASIPLAVEVTSSGNNVTISVARDSKNLISKTLTRPLKGFR